MQHLTEISDKHGNPLRWTQAEIVYLLSQLRILTDAGLESEENGYYADDIAAKGIKIALLALETKIDAARMHNVKNILGFLCIDCINAINMNDLRDGTTEEILLALNAGYEQLCHYNPTSIA